jgi:hypothetical protein
VWRGPHIMCDADLVTPFPREADVWSERPRCPLDIVVHAVPRFTVQEVGLAGKGLVATAAYRKGDVVAGYPAQFAHVGISAWYDDRQVSLRECMPRSYSILLDSAFYGREVRLSPSSRPQPPFMQAHYINDACPSPTTASAARYACTCRIRANAELVDVGDLLVAVATRQIAPGAEILVAYGHAYWRAPLAGLVATAIETAVCEVVQAAAAPIRSTA